jgi:hypothetical protein
MNRNQCRNEKNFTRIMGVFVLALGLLLALVGFVILPVVGLIFAVPVIGLACLFIAAPDSKTCKLILKQI